MHPRTTATLTVGFQQLSANRETKRFRDELKKVPGWLPGT
jgi:hypothetical protein